MDLFEAIERRYSYRGAFTDAPVPRDDLKKIVAAGLKAPSGKNAQTTTFVIVDDPAIMDKIRACHAMKAVKDAKAFIVACTDEDPEPIYFDMHFQVEDCSTAVEHILLAVTALGYATVWIDGALRRDGRAEVIGEAIGIPAGRVARILLPIGVPTEDGPRKEKKPFEERAWFNEHGG
jgi:nitroreductase